jgi:signal peptide peptidase SppA
MKNKPELISFSDFLMIAPFYDIRSFFRPEIEFLKGGNEALQISGLIKEDQSELIEYHNRVAVLTIEGPLRPGRDWYFSTGYGDIQDAIDELLENDQIKTVIQKIDSPGGTVKEAFETEDRFKELAENKNLISLVTGSATSGAALMTFPAHERYLASKTAQTGSIGVVTQHIDNTEWYKMWGEERTSIAKGAFKDAGTDIRGYDDKAKIVFENAVSKLYDIFVDSASTGLNRSKEAIEAQESRVYIGQDGIDQGFADGFASLNELIETHNNNTLLMPERPAFSNIQSEERMDRNQYKAEHPGEFQAICKTAGDEREAAVKQTYIEQGEASGILKERARMNAIDELCMSPEFTAKAKKEDWSAEKSASEYLKAEAGKREEIKTNIEGDLNDPLVSDSPDMPKKPETEVKNPVAEYEAAVMKAMDGGKLTRGQAMKMVKTSNPELHASFIEAQNQGGK